MLFFFASSLMYKLIPVYFIYLDIAYGSKLDIRHMGTSGGYLHSHDHGYPGGSKRKWCIKQNN